ncbi:Peptidoglycan-binding Lysin subgroup protein [Rutstroemia sp. NJR-2017a BBW]|nr:Peptidoglycan-binding Lysin subgroup protein [Rutstroemia sp. NJR-2017a BBW]
MLSLTLLVSSNLFGIIQGALLYNGLHKVVLSADISDACDIALNTELNCESLIQLTPYSIQSTNWTTSSLESLCTTACKTGLTALHSVSQSACADDTFYIDGNSMSLHELVDLIDYKWSLICLKDASTQEYCMNVEDSWNITTMVANGAATWPTNTQKCYLDSSQGFWQHITDENGACIEPDWEELNSVFATSGREEMSAIDYYVDAADPVDDDNYGWVDALDFDEYPLEIQCSSCFLEITEQVWANMQRNCGLNEVLTPAHNVSGVIKMYVSLASIHFPRPASNDGDTCDDLPPITTDCPQTISIPSSETYTCREAVEKFRIPSAGLYNLNNDLDCSRLTDRTICAPMSCPILVVNTGATDFANMDVPISTVVQQYTNLTLIEFYTYNYFISYDWVGQNDTICIGLVALQHLLAFLQCANIFAVPRIRCINQVLEYFTATVCFLSNV